MRAVQYPGVNRKLTEHSGRRGSEAAHLGIFRNDPIQDGAHPVIRIGAGIHRGSVSAEHRAQHSTAQHSRAHHAVVCHAQEKSDTPCVLVSAQSKQD